MALKKRGNNESYVFVHYGIVIHVIVLLKKKQPTTTKIKFTSTNDNLGFGFFAQFNLKKLLYLIQLQYYYISHQVYCQVKTFFLANTY